MKKRSLAGIFIALAAIFLVALGVTGCGNLSYYWQNTQGHIAVMNAAKPVQEWLDDAQTSDPTKRRLQLAQRIREFASKELALPNNASYRRYADLKRSAVVWNVVAAPPYSLQLKTWCFAVVGCVGYRGYYNEADAKAEAERVKAEGYEVNVYGVPAYSTLGYLNWVGGDPLLNTFITYPEGELARMIFHELAHQVLYVKDDTTFNESFATAVERLGGQLWLNAHGSEAARKEYEAFDGKRREFKALALRTRERLSQIYKQNRPLTGKESAQNATDLIANQKQLAMQQLRDEYAQLRASWGGFAGYDRFIAQANNASLGAQAAYDELVPQFEAVFEKNDKNWKAFYQAIQSITHLPKDERRAALLAMTK
ncbi:MAG: aminopeptidase [Burkholderiales bacterium]|nr:MAG: aminopeptidase [Burkholderiales bacterium]